MKTFGPIELYSSPNPILFQFFHILKAINTFFLLYVILQKGLNYVYTFSLSFSGTGGLFYKNIHKFEPREDSIDTLQLPAPQETKPFPSVLPNPLSGQRWEEGMEKEGDYFEVVSDLETEA